MIHYVIFPTFFARTIIYQIPFDTTLFVNNKYIKVKLKHSDTAKT